MHNLTNFKILEIFLLITDLESLNQRISTEPAQKKFGLFCQKREHSDSWWIERIYREMKEDINKISGEEWLEKNDFELKELPTTLDTYKIYIEPKSEFGFMKGYREEVKDLLTGNLEILNSSGTFELKNMEEYIEEVMRVYDKYQNYMLTYGAEGPRVTKILSLDMSSRSLMSNKHHYAYSLCQYARNVESAILSLPETKALIEKYKKNKE